MSGDYDWPAFYAELHRVAPRAIQGIRPGLRAFLTHLGESHPELWHDEFLHLELQERWSESPERAVRWAISAWTAVVCGKFFADVPGPLGVVEDIDRLAAELSHRRVRIAPDLVRLLVDVALVGHVGDTGGVVLNVGTILTPYGQTNYGRLVAVVAEPWLRLLQVLHKEWHRAFQIHWRDWEGIVAAFDHAGFDRVTLTPGAGDLGRDVIAERHGVGRIRIVTSVKALGPGRTVDAEAVRALAGIMAFEPGVTHGMVVTTRDFAPRVRSDRLLAPLMPHRLRLMNGAELRGWLMALLRTRG